MYDAAIVGGGIAGMATAARLQSAGLSTVVFEAHGQVGGCAGFFRRKGFSFDVGATTLVDFEPGGVGGQFLESIGMKPVEGEALPGYVAWLPDRRAILFRETERWKQERLRQFGDTQAHRRFWKLLDHLAEVFWRVSRGGAKLPLQSMAEVLSAARLIGLLNLPLASYMSWTMGDALRRFGLRDDRPLAGLLAMLIEDTVHGTIDDAPLINSALGITIRGAGLTRARGGMRGFWRRFVEHYLASGGNLRVGCSVKEIYRGRRGFVLKTQRGDFAAEQVISAVPASLARRLAARIVGRRLDPFLQRDSDALGGAIIVFLGVPEVEVGGQPFTHHQLLHAYDSPLGNGNNMFISVSAPGDIESAPRGFRAVMISTHCDLDDWKGLSTAEYLRRKHDARETLIALARRVYPELGRAVVVREVGTPRTYERFTHRPGGAVGGVRQKLGNSNQRALPHDIGVPGFYLVGDSTWPGLGTVAGVIGSRIVAERVFSHRRRKPQATRRGALREEVYQHAAGTIG